MSEIEISQALRIIDRILEPESLSGVQELILRECWQNKSYQEIASASGYDSDYIRVVGSRLWQNLSLAFEEKVSKNNFKSVFRQKTAEAKFSLTTLEFPDGQVALNSNFYIDRPPIEAIAYQEIFNPAAFIAIESPLKMGKTSLMIRILAQARSQNYRTVTLNFQLAEASVLSDLEKFLRWLMANITLQLGIKSEIDRYWDRDLGNKISCTTYFQKHILEQLSEPLVLAFDEVERLFDYPEIFGEFLPLVRFWHEEANNAEAWQRLRTIVVYSTDVYARLNIHQSPFNLGLPITLPEFNLEQVKQLAHRYQFQQKVEDCDRSLKLLMEMVGGYPYLLRLAFHVLTQDTTLEDLLAKAPTPSGIYRSYLQNYFATIREDPELFQAFASIVADSPVQISSFTAYKLENMGAIKYLGEKVIPSCKLYLLYFRDYLTV